jgi:hypothetical protein
MADTGVIDARSMLSEEALDVLRRAGRVVVGQRAGRSGQHTAVLGYWLDVDSRREASDEPDGVVLVRAEDNSIPRPVELFNRGDAADDRLWSRLMDFARVGDQLRVHGVYPGSDRKLKVRLDLTFRAVADDAAETFLVFRSGAAVTRATGR